ncbi:MAG: RNA polymerase subunit sigma-70 [Kofleriaceae bacterium]|nr:RNA polymerase subunit sigma-70 [Kofleriaceae bacterium]MBP9167420.1 RNA polymerase subunit sigma-70 [Kofleriaceae bacterium]MBP9860700.1 RNA polymerase subunit sigma-70 [Kofleriaceae bacterium]
MAPPTPAELDAHRPALTGHGYRMLGSASDAEDAVQETLLRAWRAAERFEGRAALRTWLYRIATNVCLDLLGADARRVRPYELGAAMALDAPDLTQLPAERWVEPIADARVIDADAGPGERALARERVRLAFVAALQHLPPRQRAALLLMEAGGLSVEEVAATLDTTVAAVNSALQRARATLASRAAEADAASTPADAGLVDRFVLAFERYDLDALARLLCEDARQNMPPYRMWLQGRATIAAWMAGPGAGCRGSRLVVGHACGGLALAQYRRAAEVPRGGPEGGHAAWALIVLEARGGEARGGEARGGEIAGLTYFLDVERAFPQLGLPLGLAPGAPAPADGPFFLPPDR